MKKYIFLICIVLFAVKTDAQRIPIKPLNIVCSKVQPLQQIGGPRAVADSLLIYQVCVDTIASDNENPRVAKHLVGFIKVINNSKRGYGVMVYYFWKGNQVNTPVTYIKPGSFQLYKINLQAKPKKENQSSNVEVRCEVRKLRF